METVAEKPAYRRAFAVAALPAAGRRLLRVVPHRREDARRASREAAVLHPAQGRRRRSRWPGSTRSGATRPRPTTTRRPVPLDLHGDHHRRRGRRRPDPRPDAADGRARPLGGVARPAAPTRTPLLDLLVPAAPGRLEAYPVSTLVSNVRNNGPELLEPLPLEEAWRMTTTERSIDTPHGEARLVTYRARRAVRRRCCSATVPAAASTRATCEALAARAAAARASPSCCSSSRGGWPAARSRPRRRRSTSRWWPRPATLRVRTPLVVGGRSAGARSAARSAPGARCGRLPGAGVPAAPAGPAGEVAARRAARRRRADARRAGRARHDGPARGVPRRPRARRPRRRARRRPRAAGAEARPRLSQADAMEIVVESTLEWLVREVAGLRPSRGNDAGHGGVPVT